MKIFKTSICITVLFIAAAFASCANKSTNTDEFDEEYNYENDTCNCDSGTEVFCNYLSSEDWPQDAFFSDMVEVYNAYINLNGMKSVLDAWERNESSETALQSLQYVDLDMITTEDLKIKFSHCIEIGQQLFSKDFYEIDTLAFIQFNDSLYYLDSTLTARFNVSNYVDLSIDDYWNAMDFAGQSQELFENLNCKEITDDNFTTTEAKKDMAFVLDAIKNESDFDKKCAYTMQYTHYAGFYNVDMDVIEGLLDDGRYSPYLFFLWRVWRCGVQLRDGQYGPSTWAPIPNKMFNEKRLDLATTTLNYLKEHRDDAIAINQFLMTATLTNIMRFGQFPTGNESFTELFYLGL